MRNWLKFLLIMAGLGGLSWWTGGIPLAGGATFGAHAPFASASTDTAHKFHGKDVRVTVILSRIAAHGNGTTVMHLRYHNLTNRQLNLESAFTGYIDPKAAVTMNVPDTDNYDFLPVVIASLPKVRTYSSGYGTTWTSTLAPKGSAMYKFTVRAVGRRMYCLEVVVDTVTKNKVDLNPIAGAGVGCARIA